MSKFSAAVCGIPDEGDIRQTLIFAGIDGFRRQAGYIPDVMSLTDEPKPMSIDWRSCPYRTRFSEYHTRWVQVAYGLTHYETNVLKWFNGIPWSEVVTYQDCCHLSSNACSLSRRNKLRFS